MEKLIKNIFPSYISEYNGTFYLRCDDDSHTVTKYIPKLYKNSDCGIHQSIYGDKLTEVTFPKFGLYKEALYNPEYFGTVTPCVSFIREFFHESVSITDTKVLNFDIETSKYTYPLLSKIETKDFGKVQLMYFIKTHDLSELVWCPVKKDWMSFLESDYNLGQNYSDAMVASNEITSISVKCGNTPTICIIWGVDLSLNSNTTIVVKDESELIEKFIDIFIEYAPKFTTGWNNAGYDIPYIINRYDRIFDNLPTQLSPFGIIMLDSNQKYDIVGVTDLDLLLLYKKFTYTELESYRLDYVANHELSKGKVQYSGELTNLFIDNPEKFIEYNKVDVDRVFQINEKMKLIELAIEFIFLARGEYKGIFGTIALADAAAYNIALDGGKILPPKIESHRDDQYVGAKVNDPIKGVHIGIQVFFDITSLYPNTGISVNISPETLVDRKYLKSLDTKYSELLLSKYDDKTGFDGITLEKFLANGIHQNMTDALVACNLALSGNGFLFRRDKNGIVSQIFKTFFDRRQEIRSRENYGAKEEVQQMALKIFINSFYGALGQIHFRLYDVRLAEAITITGQFANLNSQKYVNTKLNSINNTDNNFVIIGDTDSGAYELSSFFPNFKNHSDKENANTTLEFCKKCIYPAISDSFEYLSKSMNLRSNEYEMGLEAIGNGVIIRKKKNYAMKIIGGERGYITPTFKVKGLECVKSSTPEFIRVNFRELLIYILNGCTEKEFQVKFSDMKDEYFSKLSISDIASPRNLNKLQKYNQRIKNVFEKRTPIHVKGAITHNNVIDELKIAHKIPKFTGSQKLKFVYIDEPNIFKSNCIAFDTTFPEEFASIVKVNKDIQFEKTFLRPVESITELCGWVPLKVRNFLF